MKIMKILYGIMVVAMLVMGTLQLVGVVPDPPLPSSTGYAIAAIILLAIVVRWNDQR